MYSHRGRVFTLTPNEKSNSPGFNPLEFAANCLEIPDIRFGKVTLLTSL
jgi:hypothetical protein